MLKKSLLLISLFIFISAQTYGQWSKEERERIAKLSSKDHHLMMEMLGITELRPGPSGDPKAPNYCNTDESIASPYISLPDPLAFNDGTEVKSSEDWKKRKLEIFEDFDNEMYGRLPENIPNVKWIVTSENDTLVGKYPVTIKELTGKVDNSDYPKISVNIKMTLTTPKNIEKPVPAIIELGWILPANFKMPPPEHPTWQEQLLEKGWAYAILIPATIQADNGAGLNEGIIGLVNKGKPRKLDDWGALRAWAWGASRVVDYFETNPDIDETKVCIEGLSRYGKAALVTLAYEPRIAIGFIGSSGAGGAKIIRRHFGEQIENLCSSEEYHWFAPNFIKYAGSLTPNDLPIDAHELIALCAPRPVFISVGSEAVEGPWVDAKGLFVAGVNAGPVYELLGKKGLGVSEFPPQETTLVDGEIAYRQHAGGHTVVPNWPTFIKYTEKYFEK